MKLWPRWTAKRKAAWLAIFAGLFTGGEAVVNSGIDLPGAERFPAWARVVVIVAISAGAFYFRWRSAREAANA